MSYAIAADVASEFRNEDFTDVDAAVSSAEVVSFIAQEEALIDATIANRYETPITGANAVLIMQGISIAYTAYRVAKILNLKKDVPIPEKFAPQQLNEGAAYIRAKQQLRDIQSGKIVLQDAIAVSTGQSVRSYNATNRVGPLWKRDVKQW